MPLTEPPPDDQPRLGTKRRLDIAEERERFCEAVVEHGGVRAAAEALGLHTPTVWTYAKANADFEADVWAARMIAAEKLYDECIEIADDSANDYVEVPNGHGGTKTVVDQEAIQRSRLRIETRMRVAGKLIPKVYGEQPTSANVNVGVSVGVICDEETRKRLIAVRQSLTTRHSPALIAPIIEAIEVQPQQLTETTENVKEPVPQIIPAECGVNHAQPEHNGSAP